MESAYLSIVTELIQNPKNESILNRISGEIVLGFGKELFLAILNSFNESEEKYEELMQIMEQIMDLKPYVAGYFMGRLYSAASYKMLHDVCDAIELWIYEYKNTNELKEAVMKLADEGACRNIWLDWVNKNNII